MPRPFFNITKGTFDQALKDLEDQVLTPFKKEGVSREQAVEKFGEALLKSKFPHQQGENAIAVVERWRKHQKEKLKWQIFDMEGAKYQGYRATISNPGLYIRIADVHETIQKYSKEIKETLFKSPMNGKEVNQVFKDRPYVNLMFVKKEVLSIQTTPLKEFKKKGNELFEDFYLQLESNFIPNILNKEIPLKIKNFEENARKLLADYETWEEIDQLAMKNSLVPRDREQMLARLYKLAAMLKKQETLPKAEYVTEYFEKLQVFAEDLSNEEFLTDDSNGERIFRQIVAEVLDERMKVEGMSDYQKAFVKMANWYIDFRVRKFLVQGKVIISGELCKTRNDECYQRLEGHLKGKLKTKMINEFRKEYIPKAAKTLRVYDYSEKRWLNDTTALKFIEPDL
jgi:hypothetical protein